MWSRIPVAGAVAALLLCASAPVLAGQSNAKFPKPPNGADKIPLLEALVLVRSALSNVSYVEDITPAGAVLVFGEGRKHETKFATGYCGNPKKTRDARKQTAWTFDEHPYVQWPSDDGAKQFCKNWNRI